MLLVTVLLACASDGDDSAEEAAWLENACGRWAGIADEREWDYASGEGATPTRTYTVRVGFFDGVEGKLVVSGSDSDAKLTRDYTDELDFVCDGGFWVEHLVSQYAGIADGSPYSGRTETTYDEPALVWPAELAQGDTWTTAYVGSVRVDDGDTTPIATTVVSEVLPPQAVTVPAGTWRAFAVKHTSGEGDSATTSREFVVPEVGVVKAVDAELQALRDP